MRGIHHTSLDNVQHLPLNEIKEYVNSLSTGLYMCSDCKDIRMSFFDWHMAQGMCDKCRDEWHRNQEKCSDW